VVQGEESKEEACDSFALQLAGLGDIMSTTPSDHGRPRLYIQHHGTSILRRVLMQQEITNLDRVLAKEAFPCRCSRI